MPLLTANGVMVIEGVISMPRLGVWHADLVLDTADASKATGTVAIATSDGLFAVVGVGRVGGAYVDSVRTRVVGGKGGLATLAVPKHYNSAIPVRTILADLLATAGETVSAAADAAILDRPLDAWTTIAQPISSALFSLVLEAPGAVWRINPDGTVWLGTDTFAAASSSYKYDVTGRRPQENLVELGSETIAVLPGQAIEGGHVSYVEHHLQAARVRSRIWFEP